MWFYIIFGTLSIINAMFVVFSEDELIAIKASFNSIFFLIVVVSYRIMETIVQ